MTTLSYDLLLDLYRGKASVVEQLGPDEREALRVETPLTEYIRDAGRRTSPRHIILTGNAGDGKTFAALGAESSGFEVVRDASAGEEREPGAPIEQLEVRLTRTLDAGKRLLIAVNRGQLERLDEVTRRSPGTLLASIVASARKQARLAPTWVAPAAELQVSLIDLGLLDTTSERIVGRLIEKVSNVVPTGLSPETERAFSAAQQALRHTAVRAWIDRTLTAARVRGHHATMRQLWSFLAFLATGARAPDSREPASLSDSLGARLFSEHAEGTLFEFAREVLDPTMTPHPALTREILLGRAQAQLKDLIGLALLVGTGADHNAALGPTLVRAAAVHGSRLVSSRPEEEDVFNKAVEYLRPLAPGWHPNRMMTRQLLQGVFRELHLWHVGSSFPAWQTLCFDSSLLEEAASVATEEIDPSALRLALPRPPPEAERAFAETWRPPYLLLGVETNETTSATGALRLTPSVFRSLFSQDRLTGERLTDAEALTVQRWLSHLTASHATDSVRVARHDGRPLLLTTDVFNPEKTLLTWDGDVTT